MKKHNFNSGPSILPATVIEQAAAALHDFNGIGLSILEIGHRTDWFVAVLEEAKMLVKQLMQLNDDYEVLFLHGGATTQFMQIPMNFLSPGETAAYCDNGIWGSKAIQEAGYFGNVHIAASSKDKNHTYIPKNLSLPEKANYLHITTNNTVEGTQWHQIPPTNLPLVADMSSDIFSRPMPFNQFSFIYAGAQKNMGAAGVTLVVIKKEWAASVQKPVPPIMHYQKHIEAKSLMNTPPVFAIYVALLTLRWIVAEGGLAAMKTRSRQKADLLYQTIDSLPIFTTAIAKEDRSLMNAVFFMKEEALLQPFLKTCTENGIIGVKGYRTVGGLRVSMYNALPLESVQAFCQLAKDFAQKHG
ncbi:MAG: 3-phosphoserine/phosphohydroxythreonine transaminase [Hydrotalea flava]|uniref:3-phosphoserine/phosphohydroxythreonine transaminase n=1 Tax=Hydrotalea TaxID=1004300 RepID=UPI0009467E5D|nr:MULTISPECIES: 3-phosphoserine/phosphohydroxythreonine transaminase [Hydrotalea]MBY0346625.1 3-phosphoserine/phosphohydroxythreonine transaminase [Hydrotalea flava]NIM36598.1 3-phosphoserine/phosphohydroxythreonine transaminase [Hydrotalea flava]NIM39458.1 3-phosphoserine/phosphohydroxythreonine transaminase [Hydrotalea flava]NIN04647.1 3-phosphoserine/phosphohydroxythreonine transaminase [Hydrotalea flava]NIN16319.1 3-phosphoserine/phosphohydroxythreonine transaminase [Hydrotalea flava]